METTRAMQPIEAAPPRLGVRVVAGPDAGRGIVVEAATQIGTSDLCELRLTDPTVSRRHLVVEPGEVGLRVVDHDSRNGTWLGDHRVRDVELLIGGEIRIGGTVLRVVPADATGEETVAAEPAAPPSSFGRFLGVAPALAPLYRRLLKAAATDTTVLLEGESGTGKELLAEALHEQGRRADGPFVVVDCGAMPESLIEAELFGYERGAFTGAERARAGAFEQANGGTIFLDEVGELPLALQTRLLRVLDRRTVRRLGADRAIDVDVRIVAATNRSLEREVEESRFRLDLFHRLAVCLLRVPPLRAREGDVELLARHLLSDYGGDPALLTGEVLERLRRHAWPGNVRELRNQIERLVLLEEHAQEIETTGDPLREAIYSGMPYRLARAHVLDAFTEGYVRELLRRHDGNVSRAARAAGLARRHVQRLKQRDG